MPTPPTDGPAVPFLVGVAGGGGLSPKQARHPRFAAPSRGVRIPAAGADDARLVGQAALLAAPDSALLSDVTAARWWSLPLPPSAVWTRSPTVSVAVPRDHVRQRRAGVRGRRLTVPPAHMTQHGGAWITTPARTWIDCAELLPLHHVVAMGDAILRRELADHAGLIAMVRWGRGRRGIVTARRALDLLDAGAESPPESIVRCHLEVAGLPRPCTQFDVVEDGEWLARADLAWPEQRVIVEYDGVVHADDRVRRHDATRRNLLQERGWLVIVFTARDLAHPHEMVRLVRSALASHRTR